MKGVQKKTLRFEFLLCSYLSFCLSELLILVPTPHNIPPILWGRHKNFKDLINKSWDMNKTKIQNQGFYLHTLYLQNGPFK